MYDLLNELNVNIFIICLFSVYEYHRIEHAFELWPISCVLRYDHRLSDLLFMGRTWYMVGVRMVFFFISKVIWTDNKNKYGDITTITVQSQQSP